MVEPSSIAGASFRVHAGRARGFSLLEMLIVLALLAALAGLSIPAIATRLPGARLDAAGRSIAAAVSQARRIASERGALARVVVERSGSGPDRVGVMVWSEESESNEGRDVIASLGARVELAPGEARREENGAAWVAIEDAWRTLAEGVRAGHAEDVAQNVDEASATSDAGTNDPEPLGSLTVAIILPDGGVLTQGPGGALRLSSRGSDESVELSIGSATGAVSWARVRAPEESGRARADAEGTSGELFDPDIPTHARPGASRDALAPGARR